MGEKKLTIDQEKIESVKKADANVKTMSDFTSPEDLYKELISCVKKYHPSADLTMIEKAYRIAKNAHESLIAFFSHIHFIKKVILCV